MKIMNIFLLFRQTPPPFGKKNKAMKTTGRFLILLLVSFGSLPSSAQQAKSIVQQADQYFAAGEYYTAANLYEQFLNPPKNQKTISDFPLNIKGKRNTPVTNVSRMDILFKQ